MPNVVHEWKQERAQLFERQKALMSNGDFGAEDEAEFEQIDADMEALGAKIEKHEARQAKMDQRAKELAKASPKTQDFYTANQDLLEEAEGEAREGVDLFADFDGGIRINELDRIAKSPANKELRSAFDSWMSTGQMNAALQHTRQADGGYLVMPEQYIARMIQNVDDMVHIRRLATVIPLTQAASIGVPTRDADVDDADWTTELGTGDEDESLKFGKRKMSPHPLAKRAKLSRDLLKIQTLNSEGILRERLAYKFAVTQEKAFMTGSGTEQPLGLFTAHADGIPTSRDVSEDNTATTITGDGLINAKYSLKAQYQASPGLRWVFHRNAIRNIRKLKYVDGDEHYVWKPGLKDEPDTILETPYIMSEFCPNTFTASQYVGMIGDFRHYWILEVMKYELQRLNELYATTNQVGFIARAWLDGAPVLPEAFARVQLASGG